MHKSVLSSREEEPFNLNPEMKSFIPCSTALRPIRLGKQVPLALLSKRPSPLLCCDVNSLNLFTVCMRGNWLEMEEDISVSFFFFLIKEGSKVSTRVCSQEGVLQGKTLPCSKAENWGREDRPQSAEPSRPAQICYQLQLQHGLECEESYWAGVLVQGSKPHIAAHTHFSFSLSIVFG